MSDFLRPHESQHARPPCPSPTPGVHSDSRPSSRWCHPAISSSVVPFSSCPGSLPAWVFSNESALCMRWPKYWSFSFSIIAAAKSFQSCLTLCDPIDGSPPGSSVHGILQARTLEWVAISSSNAWKSNVKVKSLSRVRLLATSWTAAYQAPPSMGFSRQEYWSGVPLPSPLASLEKCKSKPQWGIILHRSECAIISLQTIKAGGGVEKREHSYIPSGNANWCSHYGEQYRDSWTKWK